MIMLVILSVLGIACAEDPETFGTSYDAGDGLPITSGTDTDTDEPKLIDTTRQNIDSSQVSDTDTDELQELDTETQAFDTDTDELQELDTETQAFDTDTDELQELDTETQAFDTDTGPKWVCDFNDVGCEVWETCILDTVSICPLSPDPISVSAETYGYLWLICTDDICPTTEYHRPCRETDVIGMRCI